MSARSATSEQTIAEITEPVDASGALPRAIALRIVALDRDRSLLASALEQARQIDIGS